MVQLCEPGHILSGEWVCRFPGLSHFSTPPHPTQSKFILDAERRTSFILLKGRKCDFIGIVSAPLGVLLPCLIWSKTSFSAVPHHPHLQRETYELVESRRGPTSLTLYLRIFLHFISLIVPGSRKPEETSVNSWISFKGREYHKINNWKFTFHESWDLPSHPGNEPSNSYSKMACQWRCQGMETALVAPLLSLCLVMMLEFGYVHFEH